jgi:hypothetical protein
VTHLALALCEQAEALVWCVRKSVRAPERVHTRLFMVGDYQRCVYTCENDGLMRIAQKIFVVHILEEKKNQTNQKTRERVEVVVVLNVGILLIIIYILPEIETGFSSSRG